MLDGGWWEEVVMVVVRGVNEKSKVDDAFLPIYGKEIRLGVSGVLWW